MNQRSFSLSIYAGVFSALIIAGTFIRIPFGPVPVVLANFFVLLAGLLLGPVWGGTSVALYLLLGILGLPVFSAGGGAALILGPTGGYLIGYLVAAIVAGLVASLRRGNLLVQGCAAVAGMVSIYLIGVPWLIWRLSAVSGGSVSLSRGLLIGAYPYIPGDILKAIAAVLVARSMMRFSPLLGQELGSVDRET